MLDCLRDMLVERLLLYEKKNKVLPERIFVFRDGVSEVSLSSVTHPALPDKRIHRANSISCFGKNWLRSLRRSRGSRLRRGRHAIGLDCQLSSAGMPSHHLPPIVTILIVHIQETTPCQVWEIGGPATSTNSIGSHRFFPTSSQFADRNGNTQPGTVVDKGVTAV